MAQSAHAARAALGRSRRGQGRDRRGRHAHHRGVGDPPRERRRARRRGSSTRLRAAGAIVLGKLNTHEFAYGALTTSPHFGPARNPWSPERICGGSSGGSGAAAAAGLAAGTLGTDTAGSIRIPPLLRRHRAPAVDRARLERRRRSRLVDVRHRRADRADAPRTAACCSRRSRPASAPDGAGAAISADRRRRARCSSGGSRVAASCEAAVRRARRSERGRRLPLLDEAGTIQQLDHAARGDGGSSALAADAARRLRGRRPRPPARRAASAGDRVRDRPARPPLARGRAAAAVRAVRSARRLRRCRSSRRGSARIPSRLAGERIPYRLLADPVQLALELPRAAGRERPVRVRRRAAGGARARRPSRRQTATVLRAAHAFQRATDWHQRRPPVERSP